MIELSTKLSKTALNKGLEKAAKASQQAGGDFSSILDKIQGKDISEVVKTISREIDLKPSKEITVIQSADIGNQDKGTGQIPLQEQPGTVMQKITNIMGEVNDGQNKLQSLIDLVTHGTRLSPQELIAVQAGVFSLVQELELVGKATQEATQGVRQTLNTNLG